MSKPQFIEKHLDLPKGMDYEFLKREGLRTIQQLAGDNWTDFNEHDPGVTILEQLAYALSELGYRSQMDFKDLYASQEKHSGSNTFYTAGKILPTNPVTTKDMRKQLLDKFSSIQNVWVYPLNSFTRRKNIQGLYLVFIEESPYSNKAPEKLKRAIMDELNEICNFGETFEDVIILKKKEIFLSASIELEKNAFAEKVHAKVLFTLKQLISSPITYYSLNEMLDMNYPVENIFDGPPLQNGFILSEELKEKPSIFFNSQLVNHLREIDGVKTVKSLNLVEETISKTGEASYRNYFDGLADIERTEIAVVPWNSIGELSEKILNDVNNENFFRYTSDGIKINLYQKEVNRNLKELEASIIQKNSQNLNQNNDFEVPVGKQRKINNYKSIQHDFPAIYGLKKHAISDRTPNERKAEIYQLKGFLLFFEQILNNYVAQLSHFSELYSLDKNISSSYFIQVPKDIPGIYKLIRKSESAKTPQKQEQFIERTIKELMAGIDNFYERRAKFLSHLLVRFGDDSHLLNFEKFNFYHSKKEHKNNLLNQQIDILKNYPELSRDKARSFNPAKPIWNDEEGNPVAPNMSALEKRVRIMLGIPLERDQVATYLLPKVRFNGKSHDIGLHHLFSDHPELRFHNTPTEPVSIWTREKDFSQEVEEELIKGITVDEDIFRRGLYLGNFKILKSDTDDRYHLLFRRKEELPPQELRGFFKLLSEHEKVDIEFRKRLKEVLEENNLMDSKHLEKLIIEVLTIFSEAPEESTLYLKLFIDKALKYCVQFDRNDEGFFMVPPSDIWEIISSYTDEESAFKAAFTLRNELLEWNQKCETFYILDHVLLRPQSAETELNVLLNNPNSNWSFRLIKSYSIDTIEQGITDDIKKIRSLNYSLQKKGDKYLIVWKEDRELIGRSTEKFIDKSEAEQVAEEIKTYFDEFSNLDIHDPNRVKFKREFDHEDDLAHPLHHYSFTITVFLPNWTTRFCNKEFQYYLESLIRKHTPAHIGIHFKWIDLKAFAQFELLFKLWLEENQKTSINYKLLNELSDELLAFTKNIKSTS